MKVYEVYFIYQNIFFRISLDSLQYLFLEF